MLSQLLLKNEKLNKKNRTLTVFISYFIFKSKNCNINNKYYDLKP